MSDELLPLAQLIEKRLGVSMSSGRMRPLADALRQVAGDEAPEQALRWARDPAGAAPVLDRIVDALTVRETYFFREAEPLRAIPWAGVLAEARRRGAEHMHVWCAACASGEEPYTVALLAAEAFGTEAPPVRIVATDISVTALEEARAARYGPRAVRHVPAALRERWFAPEAGGFVVGAPLRGIVRFERHSLANDPPPSPGNFDLVLCRNVFMYLAPWAVRRSHETLVSALAPEGRLVLGAVDRLSVGQVAPRPRAQRRRATSTAPSGSRTPRERAPRTQRPAVPTTRPATADETVLERASRMADQGRLAEALALVERVVASAPMDAAARFLEGTLQLAMGRPREAVPALRAALYADSNFALAAFQLARALEELGEPSAGQAYRRALVVMDETGGQDQLIGPAGLVDLMRISAAKAVRGTPSR